MDHAPKRVLMHFTSSEVLTIPAHNRKVLLGILEKFRKKRLHIGCMKEAPLGG
jgi:hypothetical protein